MSIVFVLAVLLGTALQIWLAGRQSAEVLRNRPQVPGPFAAQVTLEEHQKAADYTVAKVRLHYIETIFGALVTLALTVGGGIAALDTVWRNSGWSQPWLGAAVIVTVIILTSLLNMPFNVWSTFRLEARFGFNRMTPRLFVIDLIKSAVLTILIGGPVVLAVLALMERAGPLWWLWAWGLWLVLMLVMTWAYPAVIAPLFNKFSPLKDPALRERIESLLQRCGFKSKGVFVVDGSKRSAHGNAYFTGIGRNKRIVFFDTLLDRLGHSEVEAVLAHELGHFSLKHIRKRLIVSVITSFFGLALLGWLAHLPQFYTALGVPNPSSHSALLLFVVALPVFSVFFTPIGAMWSRRHEFEADGFAAQHSSAHDLAGALVKLYRDNASTLTPDPVYSAFYYSHPPALARISRLLASASPS
ncbi:MAG TPA: M48 family metallopeptidase [Steroidobacteraceae bacterium]|jgi:STE24 endopeptidase